MFIDTVPYRIVDESIHSVNDRRIGGGGQDGLEQDPLHQVLPEFELQDPAWTRELTLSDLLSHQSVEKRHRLLRSRRKKEWFDSETQHINMTKAISSLSLI